MSAAKEVVRVRLPEQDSTFKAILLLSTDTASQVVVKVNKKLRNGMTSGNLGYQIGNGAEVGFNPDDLPYDTLKQHGSDRCTLLFRGTTSFPAPKAAAPAPAAVDTLGLGGASPAASNEPKDDFDRLLDELRTESFDGLEASFSGSAPGADTGMFPNCSSCGEPVVENPLVAFGMPWHPECLGCAVCGKPFVGGRKVVEGEDGNAYCETDFIEKFATRCEVCAKPVIGECLQALGKAYHPDCFQCTVCQTALEGAFFEHEQKIYCERHYYESLGLLCPVCEKPIFGKCVNAGGVRYHPEHFKCCFCQNQLAGNAYFEHNDKIYCKTCSNKLYG